MSAHYKVMSRKDKPRGSHHGVNPQKIEEMKRAFANVDTDGSGSIDAKELNIAMRYECLRKIMSNMLELESRGPLLDVYLRTDPLDKETREAVAFGFELFEQLVFFPEINEIIAEVDKDGIGAIEFDEFFHMITSKFVEMGIKEELMEGKISFADIQRMGREFNVNFTENEIQGMVDEADRDRDGEVNSEEFLRITRTSYG